LFFCVFPHNFSVIVPQAIMWCNQVVSALAASLHGALDGPHVCPNATERLGRMARALQRSVWKLRTGMKLPESFVVLAGGAR